MSTTLSGVKPSRAPIARALGITNPAITILKNAPSQRLLRPAFVAPLRPAIVGGFQPRHRSLPSISPAPAAAAGAAAAGVIFYPISKESKPSASTPASIDPLRLVAEVLWPDRFLVLLTAVTLVITIGLTLAFPLAIGDLFDVVRQHLASIPPETAAAKAATVATAATASTASSTLVEMISDVRSIINFAPPNFYPVLGRLCACLVLSASGNAAIAYLAPLLGERFAVRMRKRLMAETLAKDQAFFDSAGKGDITARLTLDVAVVQATVADFLGQRGIRSMLEVICSLVIM